MAIWYGRSVARTSPVIIAILQLLSPLRDLLSLSSLSRRIMAPSAIDGRGHMTNGVNGHKVNGDDGGQTQHMYPHDYVRFDPSVKPKDYQIKGTDANSKILFRDVNIIDSTGRDPFKGDVYIEGEPLHIPGKGGHIVLMAR